MKIVKGGWSPGHTNDIEIEKVFNGTYWEAVIRLYIDGILYQRKWAEGNQPFGFKKSRSEKRVDRYIDRTINKAEKYYEMITKEVEGKQKIWYVTLPREKNEK